MNDNYRIKEDLGHFTIQRKHKSKKNKGILKWFTSYKSEYKDCPRSIYGTLHEAMEELRRLCEESEEPRYHYLKELNKERVKNNTYVDKVVMSSGLPSGWLYD